MFHEEKARQEIERSFGGTKATPSATVYLAILSTAAWMSLTWVMAYLLFH